MKSTTNVFLEGLRMDLHPLATGLKLLTDALNATLITFNGNEMMLQNDMGNTLILDTATGNIMGLSPGFTPIGLKEHGGIMYIASVNKDGVGEIGTIPSPIIRNLYKEKVTVDINQPIPINTGDPIRISNKLYPADKFISNLLMSFDRTSIKGGTIYQKVSDLSTPIWGTGLNIDPNDVIVARNVITGVSSIDTLYTPLISYNYSDLTLSSLQIPILENSVKTLKDLFSPKGVYKLSLYTLHNNIGEIKAPESLLEQQMYLVNGPNKLSNYWYLHTLFPTSVFPKDLLEATLNKDLKLFPSSNKPGYMAIKLETEGITSFNILPRKEKPYDTPITLKTFNSSTNLGEYCVLFPGFYYSTDSGIYIDKLKNIRLIDESTSDPVDVTTPDLDSGGSVNIHFSQHDIQTITTWPGILGQTAYSPYYRPASTIGEFPQIQSEDDSLTFLLTTVPGVFTHTTTNFLSATASNLSSIPLSTTGLMFSEIGSKYNNWYRLELDYYDQYDNKLGTFTKRFNPYLNDVFGTNLHVSNIEYLEGLIMGQEINYDEHIEAVNNVSINLYQAEYGYIAHLDPLGTKAPNVDMDDNILYSGTFPFENRAHASAGDWLTTLHAAYDTENQYFATPSEVRDRFALLQSQLSSYIYSKNDINLISNFTSTVTHDSTTATFFRTRDVKVGKVWIDNTGSPYYKDVLGWKHLWAQAVTIADYPESINTLGYTEGVTYSLSEKVVFADKDTGNRLFFPNFNNAALTTWDYSPSFKVVKDTMDGSIALETSFNRPYIKMRFNVLKDTAAGKILKNCGRARLAYVTDVADYDSWWGMRVEVPFHITTTYKALSLKLKYSITPYFLLKGSDDLGNTVDVYRFGKLKGTDITYQHNFELGSDGSVYNYFIEPNPLGKTPSDTIQCSYNHASPFEFYNNPLSFKSTLAPGIYVLNIQRVPGLATKTDTFNENISLLIQIGSSEKVFTPAEWRTRPDYENSIQNPETYKNDYKNYIYRPIVLIIPKSASVSISTDKAFCRQSVGIFKITGSDANSVAQLLKTVSFSDHIITHDEYMYDLVSYVNKSGLSSIKLYNFMLQNGVFFKEAYVFIDGLGDRDKSIYGVTVREHLYDSCPYIPLDASILPVSLNTGGDYSWNAYVMPESVLFADGASYPNFIFSNPLSSSYTTKPGSNNLRKPII